MGRGRPTKIESILTRLLEPDRTYTVREIALLPEVAAAYKDYSAAYSAIRQLLVSKLQLIPLGHRAESAGGAMFFQSDAIIQALQGLAPKTQEPVPASAPPVPSGRTPKPANLPLRTTTALLAGIAAVISSIFLVPESSIPEQIQTLARARDIPGLRALAQSTRLAQDLNRGAVVALEQDEINHAFGSGIQLTPVSQQQSISPYRRDIAKAIATLEEKVLHLREQDLLAVFPNLEMWLYTTPQGVVSIQLGTRVKINGMSGHISSMTPTHFVLRTEQDQEVDVVRSELKIMGSGEQPGLKTLIYPHPAGNLDGLLAWAAEQLEVFLIDQADLAGQVAGYFPPYHSVQAFVEDLAEPGVRLTGDALVLLPEPQLKMHLGFHETAIYRGRTLDQHFTQLADLLPQEISWPELPSGKWWYSGQQLDTLIAQLHMTTVIRHDGSVVLIGEEQPE